MSQQNIYPSSASEELQVEHKIIILYLVDKMDMPLSNSHIVQFALEESYMNYYMVQQYLTELVEKGYLEKSIDNNTTRYTITDEGNETMNIFIKNISQVVKNRIQKYVTENRKSVKQDFETTANHFYDHNTHEYVVKCGAYEDELMLMELNLSVVSREEAIHICNNWKKNVNTLYGEFLRILYKDIDMNANDK